jgi:hypothetical protein
MDLATLARLAIELVKPNVPAQRNAAEQLARCGEEAQPVAVALAFAAGNADEQVRQWVTTALEDVGPPRTIDIQELEYLVSAEDRHQDVRYWAATLLGRLGPTALSALPALVSALRAGQPAAVRQQAAWAIGKIGVTADARGALQSAAADADPRLARLARQALG